MELVELLKPLNGGVICVSGAGGKSSLMYRLGSALERAGHRVLCTSTGSLFPPPPEYYVMVEEKLTEADLPENIPMVIVAAKDPAKAPRLRGYSVQEIEEMHRLKKTDWIIVEVGASQGRPVFAHEAGGIAFPNCTDMVIGMVGLNALGQYLDDIWVNGVEKFASFGGQKAGERITGQGIAEFIISKDGLFLDAPAKAAKVAFLNQADAPGGQEKGRAIAAMVQELEKNPAGKPENVAKVYIGAALSGDAVIYECVEIK